MAFNNDYLLINVANNKAPAEPAHSKSGCAALFFHSDCKGISKTPFRIYFLFDIM